MTILILGGTAEARSLAARLAETGVSFVSSLAGRVSTPRLPVGEVRIGGFGGSAGLTAFLHQNQISAVVDATHPFAARMSANAREASALTGIPLLRFLRLGWGQRPDAAGWHWVTDIDEARQRAESLGKRPFLTTGRQTLSAFASWADREVLVRIVEPLEEEPPDSWTIIHDRGPYDLQGERDLLITHRIDVLVTKDSGGSYTSAKLDACAELGVPVVVVRRSGEGTCETVSTLTEVLAWINRL